MCTWHFAVILSITIKYLLNKVDVNAKNKNGCTPLDILSQSRRDIQDLDISDSLRAAGAVKSLDITPPSPSPSINGASNDNNPQIPSFLRHQSRSGKKVDQNEWLSKKKDTLMIVASLLATMAFQARLNPPGGVWQDYDQWGGEGNVPAPSPSSKSYRAGEAVVAYNYSSTYKFYLRANTISFVSSLSTILLLISGLPFRRRTFMWILMRVLWLSITSMAFTYGFSIVAVTPKKDRVGLRRTMYVAIPVGCGVMALLFLGHTIRLTERWLTKKGIYMWDFTRKIFGHADVVKQASGNHHV